MPDIKSILGALSAVLLLFGYIPYIRSVITGHTKPHVFSWFIWSTFTCVAFLAQTVKGAGPGSWMVGFETIAYLTVFVLAFKKGTRKFDVLDWITLLFAILAIVLWITTNRPVLAAILVSIGDAVGFIPTYRKGYRKPFEEHLGPYAFGTIASICAVLAVSQYSLTTWLYPFTLILTNGTFAATLLVRRRRIPLPA